jgi:ABC-type branched-subunit amino acid transport system substrate-binding protein
LVWKLESFYGVDEMSADISRNTFRKRNHFRRVIEQQGRGHLDSEFNEQIDILHHYRDSSLKDIIGPTGAPLANPGFKITFDKTGDSNFLIGKGHYYVDGMLCENHEDIPSKSQSDLPYIEEDDLQVSIPKKNFDHIVYLDVWEKDITCVDDESILEPALNGVSNTIRSKLVWQVKVLPLNISSIAYKSSNPYMSQLLSELNVKRCKLQARVEENQETPQECEIPPAVGYSGLDNLLYRVEIHSVNDELITYSWSKYNKSGVAKVDIIENGNKDEINLKFLDEGSKSVFKDANWVELTNNRRELQGLPGFHLKIKINKIDENKIFFYINDVNELLKEINIKKLDKCIAWNDVGTVKYQEDAKLEHGIKIRFIKSETDESLKTGDYWLIPARTIIKDILWPKNQIGLRKAIPCALTPIGIKHHYALLAIISYDKENKWVTTRDLRNFFNELSVFPRLLYTGGNGQTGIPGKKLTFPLKAHVVTSPGVAKEVRFVISQEEGTVSTKTNGVESTGAESTATSDGDVECEWTLGVEEAHQQVSATLLDEIGNPIANSTIFYNAHLDYPYLYYVGGDGQSGDGHSTLNMPLQVGVSTGSAKSNLKVKFKPDDNNAETFAPIINGYASYDWTLADTPLKQFITAQLYDEEGPVGNIIRFNATIKEKIIPIAVNSGIITLRLQNPRPIYGPFRHSVKELKKPPAIILGLEEDVSSNLTWVRPSPETPLAKGADRENIRGLQKVYSLLSKEEKNDYNQENEGTRVVALLTHLEENDLSELSDGRLKEINTIIENFVEDDFQRLNKLYKKTIIIDRVLFMEDYNLSLREKTGPIFKAVHITSTDFRVELKKPLEYEINEILNLRWWAIPANEQDIQGDEDINAQIISGKNTPEEILFELSSKYEITGSRMLLTYKHSSGESKEYDSNTIVMEYDKSQKKYINQDQMYKNEHITSLEGSWEWQWLDIMNVEILKGSFTSKGKIETVKIGALSTDEKTFSMMLKITKIAQYTINEFCETNHYPYNFEFQTESANQTNLILEKIQAFKSLNISLLVTAIGTEMQTILPFIGPNMICIDAINTNLNLAKPNDGLYRIHPKQGYVLAENLWSWGIKSCFAIRQSSARVDDVFQLFNLKYTKNGGRIQSQSLPETDFTNLAQWLEVNIKETSENKPTELGVQLFTNLDVLKFIRIIRDYPTARRIVWFGNVELANKSASFGDYASTIDEIKLVSPMPVINSKNKIYTDFENAYKRGDSEAPSYDACLMYDACWVIAKSFIVAREKGSLNGRIEDKVILETSNNHEGTTGLCTLDENGDRTAIDYTVWQYVVRDGALTSQEIGYYNGNKDHTTWIWTRPIIIDTVGMTDFHSALEKYADSLRKDPQFENVIEENSRVTVYFNDAEASSQGLNSIEFRVKRQGENTRGVTATAVETGKNSGIYKAVIEMSNLGKLKIGEKTTTLLSGEPTLELSYEAKNGETATSRLSMKKKIR